MDALTSRAVSGQQCSTSYTKSTLLRSPHSIGRQHRTQRGPIQVDQPQGSFALQHRQDSANRPRHSLLRLQSKQHRHVYVRSSSALGSPEPADKSPEQGQSASGGDDQLQGTDSSSKGSEEQDLWSRLSRILLGNQEPPTVPWDIGKVFQVMTLWVIAYIFIGQVAVPAVLSALDVERMELSMRGQAVLHLCLDIAQLAVTLITLRFCLHKYKPRQQGLFRVQWKGWWVLWVLAAALCFPAVDWLSTQSMNWFPLEDNTWASHLETSLTIGDWITNIAYFSVVSICAPVWEEAIFRGFLLISLVRYIGAPAAVLASSIVFAMCHFRVQTFLPLLALGIVFSCVFLRTNNLLPPIVLHSLWNVYVLLTLVCRSGM